MDFRTFNGKGTRPLLWVGSRAVRAKITVSALPSSAEVKGRVERYLYSSSDPFLGWTLH
jgi:hypothetical protein